MTCYAPLLKTQKVRLCMRAWQPPSYAVRRCATQDRSSRVRKQRSGLVPSERSRTRNAECTKTHQTLRTGSICHTLAKIST